MLSFEDEFATALPPPPGRPPALPEASRVRFPGILAQAMKAPNAREPAHVRSRSKRRLWITASVASA
jgi:hypothetical protein